MFLPTQREETWARLDEDRADILFNGKCVLDQLGKMAEFPMAHLMVSHGTHEYLHTLVENTALNYTKVGKSWKKIKNSLMKKWTQKWLVWFWSTGLFLI